MNASFAYDYLEPLEDTEITLRAVELQERDTIVADGCVPIHIDRVRHYEDHGFVVIDYTCGAGSGSRSYIRQQQITVLRPNEEAAH